MGSTALHFSHHAALKSTTTCAHRVSPSAVAAQPRSCAHRLRPSLHQRLAQLRIAAHLTHVRPPGAARSSAFSLGRERRRRTHQAGRSAARRRHACTQVAGAGAPASSRSGGAAEQLVWTREGAGRVDELVPARRGAAWGGPKLFAVTRLRAPNLSQQRACGFEPELALKPRRASLHFGRESAPATRACSFGLRSPAGAERCHRGCACCCGSPSGCACAAPRLSASAFLNPRPAAKWRLRLSARRA